MAATARPRVPAGLARMLARPQERKVVTLADLYAP